MLQTSDESRELKVLETVASDPEVRQADIATQLGVAVGTVNWVLKRLVSKGYVKVKRIGRWQWKYLLTPRGLAHKAALTRAYIDQSLAMYRQVRSQAEEAVDRVEAAGFGEVVVDAPSKNEIAEICRLTCIERGISISDCRNAGNPVIRIEGRRLALEFPAAVQTDEVPNA